MRAHMPSNDSALLSLLSGICHAWNGLVTITSSSNKPVGSHHGLRITDHIRCCHLLCVLCVFAVYSVTSVFRLRPTSPPGHLIHAHVPPTHRPTHPADPASLPD